MSLIQQEDKEETQIQIANNNESPMGYLKLANIIETRI